MSMPLSRASWMMRLMGAESGATIAMIRLAARMFPKPMLMRRGSALSGITYPRPPWSLDILDLLPHALQLALHGDDRACDLEVVGLGAGRVHLAAHLLEHELQAAPDGSVGGAQVGAELSDVTAEPGDLLAHIASLREDRHLGGDPSFVHRHLAEEAGDPLAEAHDVLADRRAGPVGDQHRRLIQPAQPRVQILGEPAAL